MLYDGVDLFIAVHRSESVKAPRLPSAGTPAGTTFRVIYRRLNRSPALIACGVLGDKRAGIREVDFLARTGAGLVVVVIGEAFAVYQKPSHLKFVQSPLLSASVCQ